MDVLFALMLAALLVTTLQILGVTMVISAVVILASIVRLLSDKFSHMIFISAGLCAFFSLFDIYLSYYFDIASEASVVLLSYKRLSRIPAVRSIESAAASLLRLISSCRAL